MVDIQTFRQQIGSAPSINSRILKRKSRLRKDDHREYENLLLKSLPRSSSVAGFLFICAILFLPIWLEENYVTCISCQETKKYYHIYNKVTMIGVVEEGIIGEMKLSLYHPWFLTVFNMTIVPDTVFETVFRNITKEKGSVTFIDMLLLKSGVESNPGPTGSQFMGLNDLYKDGINEEPGKFKNFNLILLRNLFTLLPKSFCYWA